MSADAPAKKLAVLESDIKRQLKELLEAAREGFTQASEWEASYHAKEAYYIQEINKIHQTKLDLIADVQKLQQSVEDLLPMAENFMVLARAAGEEDDPFAAWETIFPALGVQAGAGDPVAGDDEIEPLDHEDIERAKRLLKTIKDTSFLRPTLEERERRAKDALRWRRLVASLDHEMLETVRRIADANDVD